MKKIQSSSQCELSPNCIFPQALAFDFHGITSRILILRIFKFSKLYNEFLLYWNKGKIVFWYYILLYGIEKIQYFSIRLN